MTLLEQLGGPKSLAAVADALYDRLLADDELGSLFADTHMPMQRERLTAYLVSVTSGTETTEFGLSAAQRLRAAHAGRGVTDRHFSIMASHLVDVLDAVAVDAEPAAELLALIADRRADIVSASIVADSWDPVDPSV